MGLKLTVCTVVGVEVAKTAFYIKGTTRERGCKHPLPSEVKFCPQCGEPAWLEQTDKEPLPLYDEDGETFAGLDVFPDQYGDEDQRFFVGTATMMDAYEGIPEMLSPDIVEETKQQLKTVLEPLDLWDEDKFGIWTFVQSSF